MSRSTNRCWTGWLGVASLILLSACDAGNGANLDQNGRPPVTTTPGTPPPAAADFQAIQQDILTPVCTVCHAGGAAPVGLRLDAANSYDMLVGVDSVQVPSLKRVAPGDPDNSYFLQKIQGTAAVGGQMPLGGPFLSSNEVSRIRQWISDGAPRPNPNAPSAPPQVVALTPAAGSVVTSSPATISAVFDQAMDPGLFGANTFTVTGSGGDGGFSEGNEVAIAATAITLNASDSLTATFDLGTTVLGADLYQVTLFGTGSLALASQAGQLLDGDADGNEGGNFVAQFEVTPPPASTQPTWRSVQDTVFTPVCVQCHVAGGQASFLPLDEANSYSALVGVASSGNPQLLRVAPLDPDNSYLVQKLEGTAAVGAQMPLGLPPLSTATIAAIRDWISDGARQTPGGPLPDVDPPQVALSAPTGTLTGSITISVTASDASAITAVRLLVDGTVVDTLTSSPFDFTWDTASVVNGDHSLTAQADDAAGNTGSSAAVTVTVNNAPPPDTQAPVVTLDDPGSPLAATVALTATASDNVGVTTVRFFAGTTLLGEDTTAPYSVDWDTTAFADGAYALTAEADDAAANSGTSTTVNVTVSNAPSADISPPTVTLGAITTPASGSVSVSISASDDVAVTVVRLIVDGAEVGSSVQAPYAISWNTTVLADGNHVVTALAEDAAGNRGAATPVVIALANGGPQPTLAWIQDNVFTPSCASGCHQSGGIADFLWLDAGNSFGQLVNVGTSEGGPPLRVAPGDPDNSSLVQRLEGTLSPSMPLGGSLLSVEFIGAVRQWISSGADETMADSIPPAVALGALPNPVTGVVMLTAEAADDTGVTQVQFQVDGVTVGTATAVPYTVSWNSASIANGSYAVTAVALDAAGNSGSSPAATAFVNNTVVVDSEAPVVTFAPPSTLSGTATLTAEATDNVAVSSVRFFANDQLLGETGAEPYSVDWDTTSVADGAYALRVEASDAAGNVGTSTTVSVTVDNAPPPDTEAPTVTVNDPGSPLAGTISLAAVASDNTGVVVVRFFAGTMLLGEDTSAPYSVSWDTTAVADGDYSLMAEADDAAGNTGSSAAVTVTVNNAPPPDTQAPVVTLDDPGSPLAATVALTATASDNVGVTTVRFFAGTTLLGEDTTAPYSVDWDTTAFADGAYALTAEADDAAANSGTSTTVNVTVSNAPSADISPPTVTLGAITTPASGSVSVSISASDDVAVTVVRLIVDGAEVGSSVQAPYAISWNTTVLADGNHVVTALAEDAAGNRGAATPVVIALANGGPQPTLAWIQDNVFTPSCASGCHQSGGIADFLWLDAGNSFGQLVNVGTSEGGPPLRVAPGDPDNSSLVQRLEGTLSPSMPLGGSLLSVEFIGAVRQWISSGADETMADSIPPAVALGALPNPVTGVVMLTAEAADDTGVTQVQFQVDGVTVGTATAVPYTVSWNSASIANGSYAVTAVALDAAGNSGSSPAATAFVNNTVVVDSEAPVVSFSAPSGTISGDLVLPVTATDNVAVSVVNLLIDGAIVSSTSQSPYSFTWDSRSVAEGSHTLAASASDPAGNVGAADAVTIEVSNGPNLAFSIGSPATAVDGDEFAVLLSVTNNDAGAASDSLQATIVATPAAALDIRDPGPTQNIAPVAPLSTRQVIWTLRGDNPGPATINLTVTASGATVAELSAPITITE